ncbi:hypothetical protein D3C76_1301420 [compost metagenome]
MQLLVADVAQRQVGQAYRQPYRHAQAQQVVQFSGRGAFEQQHHQRAEGHVFAVVGAGPLAQLAEAAVHGMGGGHAVALETDAAHQRVGLDYPVQRLGHDVLLARPHGLHRVLAQHPVAQLGDGHRGEGRLASPLGGAKAEEVVAIALYAGAGLVIGGQGIADASHQQAHRGLGDHLGVDHHYVGAACMEQYVFVAAVGVVEH